MREASIKYKIPIGTIVRAFNVFPDIQYSIDSSFNKVPLIVSNGTSVVDTKIKIPISDFRIEVIFKNLGYKNWTAIMGASEGAPKVIDIYYNGASSDYIGLNYGNAHIDTAFQVNNSSTCTVIIEPNKCTIENISRTPINFSGTGDQTFTLFGGHYIDSYSYNKVAIGKSIITIGDTSNVIIPFRDTNPLTSNTEYCFINLTTEEKFFGTGSLGTLTYILE